MKRVSSHYYQTIAVCIVSVFVLNEAQTVEFSTPNNVVVIDQKVQFLCSFDNLDVDQDLVEIRFNGEPVIQMTEGVRTYVSTERPESYYGMAISHIGIGFTINKVEERDAGRYQCFIQKVDAGKTTRHDSSQIMLFVQHFPKPVCFGIDDPDVIFNSATGEVSSTVGSQVQIICSFTAESNPDNLPGSLNWSRSDGKTVQQSTHPGLQVILLTVSLVDSGVHIVCHSTYKGMTQSCQIKLFVTSFDITTDATVFPMPSYHTQPTVMTSMLSGSKSDSVLPLALIVGASFAACFLLLILITIILCIRKVRSPKTPKRLNTLKEKIQPNNGRDGNNSTSRASGPESQSQVTPHYESRITKEHNQMRGLSAYSTHITNDEPANTSYYSSRISSDQNSSSHTKRHDEAHIARSHSYNEIQETNQPEIQNGKAKLPSASIDTSNELKKGPICYAELDFSDTVHYSSIQT